MLEFFLELRQPRAVVVFPFRGALFWTEWSRGRGRARIARAQLDGTNATTIRDREIGWPNGLAIDTEHERVAPPLISRVLAATRTIVGTTAKP